MLRCFLNVSGQSEILTNQETANTFLYSLWYLASIKRMVEFSFPYKPVGNRTNLSSCSLIFPSSKLDRPVECQIYPPLDMPSNSQQSVYVYAHFLLFFYLCLPSFLTVASSPIGLLLWSWVFLASANLAVAPITKVVDVTWTTTNWQTMVYGSDQLQRFGFQTSSMVTQSLVLCKHANCAKSGSPSSGTFSMFARDP